jgi:HemY protein
MTRAIRAKADPTWIADGRRSDRWMPVSPVTGRLDAFEWTDPVATLHADEPVIEYDHGPRTVAVPAPPPPPPVSPQIVTQVSAQPSAQVPTAPASTQASANVTELRPLEARVVEPPPSAPPIPSAIRGLARTVPSAAPVVPLVPVPDDPGPDPQPQLEPETDATSTNDSWRKLRGLFK